MAGIGINVNGGPDALPAAVRPHATTLEAELGCDSCIPDLEALVLQSVGRWVRKVRDGHDDEVLAAFRARDVLHGKRVLLLDGATQMTGEAVGIDGKGWLRVRGPDGAVHAFATGTVKLA